MLGPLLFIIYINKIVSVLQHSSLFMYADDLAIAVSHTDPYMVKVLLQTDLDAISSWCDIYRLTVNSDKTHLLWCKSGNDTRDCERFRVFLSGKTLKVVKNFNYLGVLIVSGLLFNQHCVRVANSGKAKLSHLRRLKKWILICQFFCISRCVFLVWSIVTLFLRVDLLM